MLLSLEYAVAAFKDQVRADGILLIIESLVEGLLLWQKDDCAEIVVLTRLPDRVTDVSPDVWCVVAVEVDDGLGLLLLVHIHLLRF